MSGTNNGSTSGAREVAEVIVVGGGPAGAATAFALARAGVDVLILDRAEFPRDKPCAEYLSPQASRLLSDMGVLAAVEAAGPAQLTGMEIRSPAGITFRGDFVADHGFSGFRDRGLAIRRRVLDHILVRQAVAAGARLLENVVVTDVTRDAAGRATGVQVSAGHAIGGAAVAGLSDPDPVGAAPARGNTLAAILSARAVVGADGLRSVVARRLGLARSARWPRRVAFMTHYRGVEGMGTAGEMHVERDGYVGLADVGHGETNVAIVVPAAMARGVGANRAAFLEQWIGRRPHLAARFREASRVSPVRVTGPFAQHARRAWAPGAGLVGDAADFFDPFTGEGIYAALRGAELLVPYLYDAVRSSSRQTADASLAAYDRCRHHEFRTKWIVERAVGVAVAVPALIEHAARVLARRRDMADLLVGVTGDFVPAGEVLRMRYLARLLMPPPAAPRATDP